MRLRIGWTILVLAVILALAGAISKVTSAGLTGSQITTLERSDTGEMYASVAVVLDLALAPQWSAVVVYDQAVTWVPGYVGMPDRRTEWDISGVWRPSDAWSISVGRRWRVGPCPDYGGPWTYVQVWRGL